VKTHVANTINLLKSGIGLTFLLLALAIAISSIPAHAQDAWKIDGEHSVARFSLGSSDIPVEVGVARVGGNVIYDNDDPSDPQVNFTINSEKGEGADSSEISFKSNRSELWPNGQIAVIGDLKVTTVEHSVSLDPSEGYYGATYSEPVLRTDSREISLLLPAERPVAQNGRMQLLSSTQIAREYFPELVSALAPGKWPMSLVQDEQCALPSGLPGEGYAGAVCTGNTVAATTNAVASGTPGIGEGYYGFEPAVTPNSGMATIALELHLTQQSPAVQAPTGLAGK
jgi:polyisoprenoid-binding protein YceI